MVKLFQWLVPVACIAAGLYMLRLSYAAHARYLDYLSLGDPSGAELPEIDMWALAIAGVLSLAIGAFLGGWFAGRR